MDAEALRPEKRKVPEQIGGRTWEFTESQLLSIDITDRQIMLDGDAEIPVGHLHLTESGIRLTHNERGTGPISEDALAQIRAYIDADPALRGIRDQYLCQEVEVHQNAINNTALSALPGAKFTYGNPGSEPGVRH